MPNLFLYYQVVVTSDGVDKMLKCQKVYSNESFSAALSRLLCVPFPTILQKPIWNTSTLGALGADM